jgi:hypothetical protein
MEHVPTTELEYAKVATLEPTNREQRRLAVKNPCWYLYKPEWWQRRARR